EEEASGTRVALAEARAARVETERAHLVRESDEMRLGDEERSLLARDEELAATAANLTKERTERERERSRIAADLVRAREKVAEATRVAEAAAERAGAARNDVQRIDGDLALVRGQTAALREGAERDATTQLAAMAARLHEELITAERAQRDVLAQRADAERRRGEADVRLAAAQGARGDAEVAADRLATAEADVRDLVRAGEASA